MINLGFLFYYLGPVIFLLYPLCLIRALSVKLSLYEISLVIAIAALTTYKIYFNTPVEIAMATRFFYGFLIFYLFFRKGHEIKVDRVLLFLSLLTIADAVLVNTIIPPEIMPNYADAFGNPDHLGYATNYFGFYQRPLSFGSSPSVTSALLVTLMALRHNTKDRVLFGVSVVATVMCMSGTGFLCLFIYAWFRKKSIAIAWTAGLVFIILVYGIAGMGADFVKMSPEYFMMMLHYKVWQYNTYVQSETVHSLLFGAPEYILRYGGDFALWSMVKVEGIVGSLFFLFLVLYKINRYNYQPLLIILVAATHYATFSFFPGQIIFAYVLSRNQWNSGTVPYDNRNYRQHGRTALQLTGHSPMVISGRDMQY